MRLARMIPAIGWSLSLALHVATAAWWLRLPAKERSERRHTVVSFSVVEPARAAAPRPPARPPRSTHRTAPKPVGRTVAAASPRPEPVRPTAGLEPVDLTGVTLAGGDGASWSSLTGNGQPMHAPIPAVVSASPPTQVVERPTKPAAKTRSPVEAPLVALRDLSSKPVPPSLDARLLANYPNSAKRQGVAGRAVVKARIDSDGMIRSVSVSSESAGGFGAACRRTLLGSRWSAPRDRRGHPVSTMISYACDFRVEG